MKFHPIAGWSLGACALALPGVLLYDNGAFYVRKNYPLLERLDDTIMTVRQAGLFSFWARLFDYANFNGSRSLRSTAAKAKDVVSIVEGVPVAAVQSYLAGTTAAALVLLGEILWFYLQRCVRDNPLTQRPPGDPGEAASAVTLYSVQQEIYIARELD